MDGLECSEVSFSKAISRGRIDSFYFAKTFLSDENRLDSMRTLPIKRLMCDLKSFGAYSLNSEFDYCESGIPFIRGVNMKSGFIDFDNMLYIDTAANTLLHKSEVFADTVLLSMSGTVGEVALAQRNWEYPINSNQDIAKLQFEEKYSPQMAYVFFLSRYGQNFMIREARGSVQQHVFLSQIETCRLPLFGAAFVDLIRKAVAKIHQTRDDANTAYAFACEMLLCELNMENFEYNSEITAVKSLSDSFGVSGRLDAEYYQPKYDQYEAWIKEYTEGWATVKEKFSLIKTKCDRTLSQYKYIEIGDVNVGSGSAESNLIATDDLPDNAKTITLAGDILVSTVRPNRGAIAILEEDNFLVSGAFTVLREKSDYPKETLQVLLRSRIYRDWMLRFNVGTSYPVIKDDDVLNMPLPLFADTVNKSVADKVRESFTLRRKSELLLENAKQAVEMAIEQGEEKAIAWLEEKEGEC